MANLAYLGPEWAEEAQKRLKEELTPEKLHHVTSSMTNIYKVESNAGATAIGPGWMLSPRLSAGASVPLAIPGFLRALIEPGVRY